MREQIVACNNNIAKIADVDKHEREIKKPKYRIGKANLIVVGLELQNHIKKPKIVNVVTTLDECDKENCAQIYMKLLNWRH